MIIEPMAKSLDDLFFELDEFYREREYVADRMESMRGYVYGRLGAGLREQLDGVREEIKSLSSTGRIHDYPGFTRE